MYSESEEIQSKVKKPYNKQRLLNYGAWYIGKYAPTFTKLKSKLFGKSEDGKMIFEVLDELKQYINEPLMAESIINATLNSGKTLNTAITKLKTKLFQKPVIEEMIIKFSGDLPDEIQLKKRIENYINKWKALTYIEFKLCQWKSEKEQVKKLYSEIINEWNPDFERIGTLVQKLVSSGKSEEKIIRKLLSDWFSYSDIKKWFKRKEG